MPLPAGSRLGPYEVVAPLGAGGMGEVYRARDTRLKRDVAIKVLPASFSKDADRLRRFEQEAEAASSLNHPNILVIYDIGSSDGVPYIVSELLEGETLRARLAGGAFTPRRALGHALQIADGLAAAHEKGIVHRDLKPENIFVSNDGRVKILDFGLAKLTEPRDSSTPPSDLPTIGSAPGVALGTLGYMSPEQVRGRDADARSDIFSFGAILYEMLSGRRAFQGDTSADTMTAILMKEPPDLSATNREAPPGLDRIVRHCLEKNPEQRFHSAHDLAFDLQALSDVSMPAAHALGPGSGRRWNRAWLLGGLAIALAAAAGVWLLRRPITPTIDSLAVLPFVNASGDSGSDYLSEGITESLTNSLSQLPNLRVTARTIAGRYKGKDAEPQRVGRELGVRAVLSGKVLQRGNTLTIQTDLVDVGNGAQLWGDHYSRKMTDILAVQEEIAREISEKLRIRLSGEQKHRLTKRSTKNTEAYQAYLKGRYYFEHRNEKVLETAIQYFNTAIEKDPSYALAYSGLADSYVVMTSYSVRPPKDAYPRGRAAAAKALELDEDLADPHASLGWIATHYDWDWRAAEREFKRAIELEPSYPATAHFWYAMLLSATSRHAEAIAEMKKAAELDPLAPVIQWNFARILVYARQFDAAIEAGRRAVELSPSLATSHGRLGLAYLARGMNEEAAVHFRKALALGPETPLALYYAAGLARCGGRTEAVAIIDKLERIAEKQYVLPFYFATLFESLGDRESTLAWLERAFDDHSWGMVFLNVDPFFDDLRPDPRFKDLLRRLKLTA
ncbi:MAG: protein kinase [Acidobacteriota bacterium]|nr:protein kinase [Acidobacteriota bacterium]